jgi:hypothetical protein
MAVGAIIAVCICTAVIGLVVMALFADEGDYEDEWRDGP